MGRYQCHQCYREFSRSDSLRRHKDSGVCKEAQTNMSDSDEESVASARRSNAHGRDIFREHDPDESVEEDEEEEDETEDEDENEEEEDEEEDDDETDDENDEEYDDDSDANVKKIRPWDMLINITSDNMQDRFNETVEKTLEEYPGTDIQKAEEVAYDKLKPKYLSDIISRYKYMSEFSAALKKDPVNKKIASTAKRLRDEEDYDEDESRKYAIKKRKFLIEKMMDNFDPPSYEETEEQTSALPYKTQRNSLFPIKQ